MATERTPLPALTYTVREVAELLGVSPSTVADRCHRGDLPMVRGVGRRVLIPKRALHRQHPDLFGPVAGIDTTVGEVFS